jgi:CRP/FNR family transcriptional regulator, dissimilatory nitrate respiration regulator
MNQNKSNILVFLAQNELFRHLSRSDLDRLADSCCLRTHKKRSILFHEGQEGSIAYVLVRGQVRLSRHSESGKEIVIRSVRPGDLFAEVVLFESGTYPVTAEALTEVRCIDIRREAIRALMDDSDFRDRFIGLLMARQRYLTGRVQYLTLFDVEERFFAYFQDHFGKSSVVKPEVSRKDLAAAIGTTPESLSRLIRRLTDEGRLSWKGGKIHFLS